MAVDKILVKDNKIVVRSNKIVTVDIPDDCDCCAACPTDCSGCSSITATVTCPGGTPRNCVYTAPGSGCSWSGCGLVTDVSFGTMTCTAGIWTIPVTGIPAGCAFANVSFTKADVAGCPPTGTWTSDTVGWTCTVV